MKNLDLTKLNEILQKYNVTVEDFVEKFNFDENSNITDVINYLKEIQEKTNVEREEKIRETRRQKDEYLNKMIKQQEERGREILPLVNILEDDEFVYIEVVAPGLTKESFKVDIEKYILCISASYNLAPNNELPKTKHQIEYKLISFKKEIPLDKSLDLDNIHADYVAGILYIGIGKNLTPAPQKTIIVK